MKLKVYTNMDSRAKLSYSAVNGFGGQVSPTCPCKFLKTLVIHSLKKLASEILGSIRSSEYGTIAIPQLGFRQ